MRSSNIVIILLILILTLGIGYALIQTDLSLGGTIHIQGNTFSQTFNTLTLSQNNTVTGTPTINNKTVTSTITLTNPNDLFDFYLYETNTGTLNAMISNITINGPDDPNIEYSVTYADGQAIEQYDRLGVGASKPILVHAKFIGTTSVATEITVSLTISYTKATAGAVEKTIDFTMPTGFTGTKYTANTSYPINNNEAINANVTQYSTAEAAEAALNRHVCFKHTIADNIVNSSQLIFIVTEEMASTITGATAGTYTFDYNQYDQSVSTLQTALDGNCNKQGNTYTCSASGISITVSKTNGTITINNCTLDQNNATCS